MKTPKQLSEEVLQKISARKEKEKRIYRNAMRVGVVLAVMAIIIPLSLTFNKQLLNNSLLDNAGGNAAAPAPETSFQGGVQKPDQPNNSTENDGEMDYEAVEKDTATENAPGKPETPEDGAFEDEAEEIESTEEIESSDLDSESEENSQSFEE